MRRILSIFKYIISKLIIYLYNLLCMYLCIHNLDICQGSWVPPSVFGIPTSSKFHEIVQIFSDLNMFKNELLRDVHRCT